MSSAALSLLPHSPAWGAPLFPVVQPAGWRLQPPAVQGPLPRQHGHPPTSSDTASPRHPPWQPAGFCPTPGPHLHQPLVEPAAGRCQQLAHLGWLELRLQGHVCRSCRLHQLIQPLRAAGRGHRTQQRGGSGAGQGAGCSHQHRCAAVASCKLPLPVCRPASGRLGSSSAPASHGRAQVPPVPTAPATAAQALAHPSLLTRPNSSTRASFRCSTCCST